MFQLGSYAKIVRRWAVLTLVVAASVPLTTTAAHSAEPGPSIVVDSVLLFPTIPVGSCLSDVNFTVTRLIGGSSKAQLPFSGDPDNHQWPASGQAVGSSFAFSFSFGALTTNSNGITDTVIPSNGSPVIPNNG